MAQRRPGRAGRLCPPNRGRLHPVRKIHETVLLDARNPGLADGIAKLLMSEKNAFAGIGILHLVGTGNVRRCCKNAAMPSSAFIESRLKGIGSATLPHAETATDSGCILLARASLWRQSSMSPFQVTVKKSFIPIMAQSKARCSPA